MLENLSPTMQESDPSSTGLISRFTGFVSSKCRQMFDSSSQIPSRRSLSLEPLEPRMMMSATAPVDFTVLENSFDGNQIQEVSFLTSGHESARIHTEGEELVMGVRDTLLSDAEYQPTEDQPLSVSFNVNFTQSDSLYILTRSEGTKSVGGYRSNNEVRVKVSTTENVIGIYEVQRGSTQQVALLSDVDLAVNQDYTVTVTDDGNTVTAMINNQTVSGQTSGTYSTYKTGISNWCKPIHVDDYVIQHGAEQAEEVPTVIAENPAIASYVPDLDAALSEPKGLQNLFDDNSLNEMSFMMSNQESRRMHIEDGHLVMGVRDTVISDGEYIPTEDQPLNVSFTVDFTESDSLYVLTRSEGTKSVGGYRSNNEVRIKVSAEENVIGIYEVQGGNTRQVALLTDVDLLLKQDHQITVTDDGSIVTVTIGDYTLSGETSGSYGTYKTGISNWCKPITIDDYVITHESTVDIAEVVQDEVVLMRMQEALSAELVVQMEQEMAIMDAELNVEETQLLTSVQVHNQELSRIQGIQLFERSSLYISGNEIEPILRQTLPDIFPENLAVCVEQQAQVLNEEPGHIQDRILMQQSDYRGIVSDLLGNYELVVSDLLNQSVDVAARLQAGEGSEHDLLNELRDAVSTASVGRYITEIAYFGIHMPSAEELYYEGKRLFSEEQDLLQNIQSEQDRLQEIENFRAYFHAWQVSRGAPDLAILVGEDRGEAENGYQGTLDVEEVRKLERAQRLVEEAMSAMVDTRVQFYVVSDDQVIEDRFVYAGDGVTNLVISTSEQQTIVSGVVDTIVQSFKTPDQVDANLASVVYTFGESINIDPSVFDAPFENSEEGYSIYYLVDTQGAILGAGHAAMIMGSESEGWYFFSFGKGDTDNIDLLASDGNMDARYYPTLQEAQIDTQRYDQYMQWDVSDASSMRTAFQRANEHIDERYGLFTNNCDDVASDIIRSAGIELDDRWYPNLTFFYENDSADQVSSWQEYIDKSLPHN